MEAIRVTYAPGAGSSGGMHTWVYYVDAGSGLLAGYRFGEGHAVDPATLTTYGGYHEVNGVQLYQRRTAYDVTGDGPPRPVRVYRHENHAPGPLPDSIFVHP